MSLPEQLGAGKVNAGLGVAAGQRGHMLRLRIVWRRWASRCA